jgi:hypothetical protein
MTTLIIAEHLRRLAQRPADAWRRTMATLGDWHTRRLSYASDADVVEAAHALVEADQPRDDRCPRCHGRHCAHHRNGLECPAQAAPGLRERFFTAGLHRPDVVLRRAVPGWWSPFPPSMRRAMWPVAWAARLGVPVKGALA